MTDEYILFCQGLGSLKFLEAVKELGLGDLNFLH